MASCQNSIKIQEQCIVGPREAETQICVPLTHFDFFWLRFHPVERVFYYTFPSSSSSSFYYHLLPNLKTSLSITLQHFLPLAGNLFWPPDSDDPFVRYTPGDGVSLVVAESTVDLEGILDNSPRDASEARLFVPHLESSESRASVMSLQITLFPNKGFSVGVSSHHGVLDGKSSTLFIKAWASLSLQINQNGSSEPTLASELEPFFGREEVKDPTGLGATFSNHMRVVMATMFPTEGDNPRSLKILPFEPKVEDSLRATFVLTRGDLDRVEKKVLSKWDSGEEDSSRKTQPPAKLSSYVLTCGHALVCVAKAVQRVESHRDKFAFGIAMDCRTKLKPPIPNNYVGNCVWGHFVDVKPGDFVRDDGVVVVAKGIHSKINEILEKGVFVGAEEGLEKFKYLASEGAEMIGLAGSNRFGVYGVDFGWGRPEKVEIASVDRGLTIGFAESKDGGGAVQVEVVLKSKVMDEFIALFREQLCD